MSAVLDFLEMVEKHSASMPSEQWHRVYSSAVVLAIGAGFKFELNDFLKIRKQECYYTAAVVEGNISAARSFEECSARRPLIAKDVRCADAAKYCHMAGYRKERLHVGCEFMWQGERVTVTSFNGAGEAIACTYKTEEEKVAIADEEYATAMEEHREVCVEVGQRVIADGLTELKEIREPRYHVAHERKIKRRYTITWQALKEAMRNGEDRSKSLADAK